MDEEISTLLVQSEPDLEIRVNPDPDLGRDMSIISLVVTTDLSQEPITEEKCKKEQAEDSVCQTLCAKARKDSYPYLVKPNGILVIQLGVQSEAKIVVPGRLTSQLLLANHHAALADHPGGNRLYDNLRQSYYGPRMVVGVNETFRS